MSEEQGLAVEKGAGEPAPTVPETVLGCLVVTPEGLGTVVGWQRRGAEVRLLVSLGETVPDQMVTVERTSLVRAYKVGEVEVSREYADLGGLTLHERYWVEGGGK